MQTDAMVPNRHGGREGVEGSRAALRTGAALGTALGKVVLGVP